MISIVRSVGQQIEVAYDLLADRVVVVPQLSHRTVWLADAEAEALAESLAEAVRELRWRRGQRDEQSLLRLREACRRVGRPRITGGIL